MHNRNVVWTSSSSTRSCDRNIDGRVKIIEHGIQNFTVTQSTAPTRSEMNSFQSLSQFSLPYQLPTPFRFYCLRDVIQVLLEAKKNELASEWQRS